MLTNSGKPSFGGDRYITWIRLTSDEVRAHSESPAMAGEPEELRMSVHSNDVLEAIRAVALARVDRFSLWRGGRWSLLFSHPADFASHGFEADRWVACLRDELERLDLRVIAVEGREYPRWISQVDGCFLAPEEAQDFMPAELQVDTQDHFVTIFDGTMRARRTIAYTAGADVPSPIELAQTAAGLRSRNLRRFS